MNIVDKILLKERDDSYKDLESVIVPPLVSEDYLSKIFDIGQYSMKYTLRIDHKYVNSIREVGPEYVKDIMETGKSKHAKYLSSEFISNIDAAIKMIKTNYEILGVSLPIVSDDYKLKSTVDMLLEDGIGDYHIVVYDFHRDVYSAYGNPVFYATNLTLPYEYYSEILGAQKKILEDEYEIEIKGTHILTVSGHTVGLFQIPAKDNVELNIEKIKL